MANGKFAGGDGTPENPYLIEDAFDLDAVRNGLDKHYKLINNIDLGIAPFNEGRGWKPIGGNFVGVFDGNLNILRNMYINTDGFTGLFYENRGTIKNLIMTNVDITTSYSGGVIAMFNNYSGIIKSCSIIGGSIITDYGAGGVVYNNTDSNIINCCSSLGIIKTNIFSDRNKCCGGISSLSIKGEIINCYVSSIIEGKSKYVGGIVGRGYNGPTTIKNCYFIGNLSGDEIVAPIVGETWNGIGVENSFWNNNNNNLDTTYGTKLTIQQMQTAQTFINASWDKELLDDGITPVWKLKDGKYPKLWFEVEKYNILKQNNRIFYYDGVNFVDTELNEPLLQQNFEQYGIKNISVIPKEKWVELGNNFEILTWTNSPNIPQLKLTIPETKPYKLLDSPSIVTYTEDEEVPTLSQTVAAESKVRFLVSKDKINYQAYKNNNWITIDKSNIIEQGMTKTELESIPQEVWAKWFENEAHKNTFDILVGMYSENPNKPLIRSIAVNYAENEAPIVIDAHITPDTIHNEFATIRANVKDYEGDKISFKVLIKKAGTDEFVQVSPIEGWYNRATSEEEITQAFNYPYFSPGENDIKLIVKDERGKESEWLGKIILSNTNPIISLTYDDFSMTATVGDDENDSIAYKLSINGKEIFDYTNFVPTKAHIKHVFDTKKLKFGEENTICLEVKDTHGGCAKQEFKVIGSYRGLMFKNEKNEYFIDDKGNILMDLLFDETLIGGQTSETKKVTLENRHEFPISNVEIFAQKPIKTKNEDGEEVIEIINGDDFAEGAILELSETEMPFNPKNIIKILESMPTQGTKDFYVRIRTSREAHQGGYFYIKSTASPVVK